MKDLPAPPDATDLLRLWAHGEELHCAVDASAFEDPGAWGAALASVVRSVAQALQEQEGLDPAETARAIRAQFDIEMRLDPEEAAEEPVQRDDIGQ